MDDVKHVILRFQDQKLLDERSGENSSPQVDNESEKNEVDDSVSPASVQITINADHSQHQQQQQQHQLRDDVILHSTESALSGPVLSRHKLVSQGLKEVPAFLQIAPAVTTPIKLPLQTISDRMNWCPEYQLNDDGGVTSLVPSSGEQSLVPSETRWLTGFMGQNDDVTGDVEMDANDVNVEIDENNASTVVTPSECWCTIPPAGSCYHSNRHSGNGSGLGDDDREVCAAFSSPVVAQPRCRFMRHQLVSCPLSVTAYHVLYRPSLVVAKSSARWSQHMPRPSLDFNKMQKTCLKGRVRRKESRLWRHHVKRNRCRQQAIKLLHRWTDGRPSSSTRSMTSLPDVAGYAESTQWEQHQSASYIDEEAEEAGARIDSGVNTVAHLDPAVFRFRSIWFDAATANAAGLDAD